ncbi:transcriptional regulator, BadM/Rrf2 family [Sulfuricurvum kujiense DSM 16994]|uniref:Transcriptional regulator, BadM/Rrf2 family n=1 Tax=Sulfuricurvum kujiense (strain ATCC BAA-921 / DSM 16994 / JCM 11577 / YK-1) TaxID=709032 RepID=E4TWG6_SULKY|nr:Rrf2 family transcriptional regulator [Sulfuricurvum kujiense]ADR33784.1 transcriptional regulator, BadM/Rrf2 family [Sulfuricurvum kujiense DSM 16994]
MAALSSKAIYGLAAMHVLAHAPRSRAMQVREISAMTQISHGYLEQLLSILRRNNLVSSIRGASGGYKLARLAHEIEVIEIIEALEGPFYKIEGNIGSSLILEYFWNDIEEKMRTLFSMKLSELDQAYQPHFYEI